MKKATRWIMGLAVGMLLSSGCGQPAQQIGPQPAVPSNQEIEVLCGSSFRPPMEKLVEMYEQETGAKVGLVFGGSEDHLPKVKLKAVGDLYVTHTPYMQYTREADALLSKGKGISRAWRQIGVNDQTYYRWRREYGGLKIDQAKRLKELERENARLKRLPVDAEIDEAILRETDELR